MITLSHDMDPVANISQEYIEHLQGAKTQAAAERDIAQAGLTAATSARDEIQTWETNIDGYWDRVKAIEKKYREIEDMIGNFKNTACAVTQNSYCVAESTEILACMVRKMTAQTDSTKQALGWAIAMNFVWTLAAAGLIGWAIQKWAWPAAAPWPLVTGLILGIVVGMGRFIRDAIRANNQ